MLKSSDTSATSLRFVPPKEKKLPRYASYGAGQMKTHIELGHAKLSLRHRCGERYYRKDEGWKECFILELVDGEWYTLYHVPEGTRDDDLPWKVDAWRYNGSSYYMRGIRYSEPIYKPEEYKKIRVNHVMTRDEYAAWRVAVELERRGISP